jgi:uncharacterized membrane protein YczE
MLFIIACSLGILIGWIDSRPTWDDTGITVGMILSVTVVLGYAMPDRAWTSALLVGIWIPLWNILVHNNYATFVALAIALIGAYLGAFVRRAFR